MGSGCPAPHNRIRETLASVVIPLYNKQKYVGECIESVLAQTYKNFECIVVDDQSTDNSLAVARAYEPSIKVLSISNHGSCGARNAGILNSQGEVILPLDADDWIDPEYLSKTVPRMTEGIGIVSTDMQRFGLNNDLLPAKIKTAFEALEYNEITCCSLVCREAFLQTGGYSSKVEGYEDWDLWVAILKRGWKMVVVNEPLFHYRVAENGMNYEGDLKREKLISILRGNHRDVHE